MENIPEFFGLQNFGGRTFFDDAVINQNYIVRIGGQHAEIVCDHENGQIVAFADFCRIAWGDFRNIFIDSADQAPLTECRKWKRENGTIYQFTPSYKEMKVVDRINLLLGWIAKEQYHILAHCTENIREKGVYSWQEDKDIPEDRNDHTVNAEQYAFLPFIAEIG